MGMRVGPKVAIIMQIEGGGGQQILIHTGKGALTKDTGIGMMQPPEAGRG